MNGLLRVLVKTVVRAFYVQNTGLLLVILLIAGGFMRSIEHIALATAALYSFFLLSLYIFLWTLYTLYVTRFALAVFRANDVLLLLRLVPAGKRRLCLYLVQLQLLLPTLAYAGFMVWLGLTLGTYRSVLLIVGSQLVLSVLPLFLLERALRHPNPEPFSNRLGAWLQQRVTTPYELFFLRYLLHRQTVLLALTKGGSCLLLVGVLALYPTDTYDLRLLLLGMLFAAAVHATAVYHQHQFEVDQLLLVRNLPYPVGRRFVGYAVSFALLLGPEAAILLRNHPADVSWASVLGVWCFGHSLLLVQYVILLRRWRPLDRFTGSQFMMVIGYFFLIMYRLPEAGLSLGNWLLAGLIFHRFYDRFSIQKATRNE